MFSSMYTVESWHVGRFCSIEYESEVIFAIRVNGQSYSAAKFQCNFNLTVKVESWHVDRFHCIEYESEVLLAIGVKGTELFCCKFK